jgi:dolichol-phosphate mannosyltransferase
MKKNNLKKHANKNQKVDIVLPVYHEEKNIRRLLLGIKKNVRSDYFLIFVFRDRKDKSIDIAKKTMGNNNNYKIIFETGKGGLANAIKEGIKNTNSQAIIIMMTDLSDNPSDIDAMTIKIYQGVDIVCASRYITDGKRKGGPLLKGFLSRFAGLSLKAFTGIKTHDSTNAFKCYRKSFLDEVEIESVKGFELPLELVVKGHILGKRIEEIPTVWRDRDTGKSKFNVLKLIPYYLKWYLYALRRSSR